MLLCVYYLQGADMGFTKDECDSTLHQELLDMCTYQFDVTGCQTQLENVFALQIRVVGTNFYHGQYHTAPYCIENICTDCLNTTAI